MTQVRSRITSKKDKDELPLSDLSEIHLREETSTDITENMNKTIPTDLKDRDSTCSEGGNVPGSASGGVRDSGSRVLFALRLAVCFIAGIIFGFLLEKGRVFEPSVIRDQFIYRRFIMMKMFLSAVATGQLSMAILFVLPFTRAKMLSARQEYFSVFQNKGLLSSLLGGFLLGAGMALCGACPGMVLAQAGAGVKMSYFSLLGCFMGVVVYAVVEPGITSVTSPKEAYKKQGFDDLFHAHYSVVAVVFACLMIGLVLVFEFYFPWTTELDVPNQSGSSFITLRAWPPWVAGVLIGLLQAVIVLVVEDTLGGSSSYCTIVAQTLVTNKLEEACPYLAKMKRGIGNWWQVLYVCGAVIGGLLSAASSGTLGSVEGVSPWASFVGALIMLFGARLAAGCTSGHGLSGLGVLAIMSLFAVAAMFGGGTAMGFTLLGASDSQWSTELTAISQSVKHQVQLSDHLVYQQ